MFPAQCTLGGDLCSQNMRIHWHVYVYYKYITIIPVQSFPCYNHALHFMSSSPGTLYVVDLCVTVGNPLDTVVLLVALISDRIMHPILETLSNGSTNKSSSIANMVNIFTKPPPLCYHPLHHQTNQIPTFYHHYNWYLHLFGYVIYSSTGVNCRASREIGLRDLSDGGEDDATQWCGFWDDI